MIAAIAGLFLCQLVGEVLVRLLAVPVPGPVIGLGLMFAFLLLRGREGEAEPGAARDHEAAIRAGLRRVADALLGNLSLLFIPAAVGVVQYLGLLRHYAWPIAVTIVVSTSATLLVTALTFRLVARLHAFRHRGLVGDVEAALDREHHP